MRDRGLGMTALDVTDPAWQDLVAEAVGATAFHLPAWGRVLAETYAYPSIVLADQDGAGCVRAGAVLARVRRVGGPAWVSLPFSDHCPPLARDRESLSRLAADLADWSGRQGVPVEVR